MDAAIVDRNHPLTLTWPVPCTGDDDAGAERSYVMFGGQTPLPACSVKIGISGEGANPDKPERSGVP